MVTLSTSAVNGGASDYAHSPYCRDHLRPFLKWLLRRHQKLGGVTEIRAIAESPAKMVWSGYFGPKHVKDLVEQITPEEDEPRAKIPFGETPVVGEANFYFAMQPMNPALLARSANKLGRCQTTSDADAVCYQLFAVDVDPVRPSGISASEAEKQEARKVANAVAKWFVNRGIGFFTADSGNGYHLLIPTVPYPDVAAASANARTLLQLLASKFSTAKASVDTTIYNPGRILKLYGTKAVKGSDLPERPHRFATVNLAQLPEDVDLFGLLNDELTAYRKESEPAAKATTPAVKTAAPAKTAGSKFAAAPKGSGGWDAETSNQVLHGVLDESELPYRRKQKGGDSFYEFKDCPYHDDPDGHTYECCVIVRADGSFAAKCQHEAGAGWQDFKPLLGWDEHVGPVLDGLGIGGQVLPYRATAHGLIHHKASRDGTVEVPLTNFVAKIVGDVAEDDGAETRHVFEIEAGLRGRSYRFAVPAQQFVGMNWPVEHLGAQAVVRAGQGTKDHARAAIQLLSGDVPTQKVYTHLGWREHEDEYVYLHAGGAIGRKGPVGGVQVGLTEPFGRFVLPEVESGKELVRAVRASLRLLNVAPDPVTVPLFAGIWRAVVGSCDFSLFLAGPSGTGKTELAALAQQHWGAGLDARHLPANWSSTANANEGLAFLCKDAVLVVDDFAPTGSTYDVQRAHRDADRLLRGQGNAAGRGRMRADATLRPPKPPRGLILSTGEDVPRGQSLRSRILVLEVSPGMVNWKRLSKRQFDAAAGLYAQALSGFVHWLADRYELVRRKLMPEWLPNFRQMASTSDRHKRTPNIVADLYLGLTLFGCYARECGALTDEQRDNLLERGWVALGQAASAQVALQNNSEPVRRFLDLLNAAVAAGKAHVANAAGERPQKAKGWGWRRQGTYWEPRGDRVGWLQEGDLYLEPEAAFAVAQRLAQESGEALTIGSKTLHKRLHELNVLASIDTKRRRLVVRKTLEGKFRQVLHLRTKALNQA